MTLLQILLLAVVQGLAEMLPVSSSAHVILAQKLMGLNPGSPEMTFLLVMLHTGTMLGALLYFGKRWKNQNFHFYKMIVLATACTGFLGLALKVGIEKVLLEHILHHTKGEVENLFGNLFIIGGALLAAGILILWSSKHEARAKDATLTPRQSMWIGFVQGLCLPFRGFSRSGATISTGMSAGVSRALAEEFSFALAVALTPAAIALETRRLFKSMHEQAGTFDFAHAMTPGLIGMVFSFVGALIALKWLSSWLEKGRWHYFGFYCVAFACVVLAAAFSGV
jgi:undecaprenyl-diphosphatase